MYKLMLEAFGSLIGFVFIMVIITEAVWVMLGFVFLEFNAYSFWLSVRIGIIGGVLLWIAYLLDTKHGLFS